ncbi:MAG TPA: bile acid:sodium symporter [Pirellulales bacterium]
MDRGQGRLTVCSRFLHRHFLGLLFATYVAATIAPASGLFVAAQGVRAHAFNRDCHLSAPAMMLGVLLFAAGLGVQGESLRGILRRPLALGLGFLATLIVPIAVVLILAEAMAYWHSPTEARDVILGLAVVAAMPVAGSSAGWTRAADGDAALSLGLILLSTLLSPLTTPLALDAAGALAHVGVDGELARLAGANAAGLFLTAWVVVPIVLGIVCRWLVGGERVDSAGPVIKLSTSLVLLALCYVNASTCLPGAAAEPDWDFLLLVAAAVTLTSGVAFATGFGVARAVGAGPAQRVALVYGVGMANNGAGLSLAAGALSGCPMALLPVVAVNLVQHVIAGVASWRMRISDSEASSSTVESYS